MRQWTCGARALILVGLAGVLLATAAPALAQTPGAPVLPITGDPLGGSVTPFEGGSATPNPVGDATPPPQNPFMAPNGRNNIHDDAYMTDTYRVSGPLGNGGTSSALFARECASITFDSRGRIVTICVGLDRPVLTLMDPRTLQVLATMQLPLRNSSPSNAFTDFSGGGYFYLDNQDRAVFPTNDRHLLEVAETDAPGFTVTHDYDVSSVVPAGEGIVSVLPDWSGRLWFVTRNGLVGTVDRSTGAIRTLRLQGEGISNSFAVDETGGVFVVSDKALYRFDAGQDGKPEVSWREVYPNSGVRKPGQSDAGSGTTPTLMGKSWVTITDNADPMNIQVYDRGKGGTSAQARKKRKKKKRKQGQKRAAAEAKKKKRKKKTAKPPGARQVCSAPVFQRGASSTDQSLIATDHSIIAENNYGYSSVVATMNGGVTSPGLERVDVVASKSGKKTKRKKKKRKKKSRSQTSYSCRSVWRSDERAPSVVPKLSLANGLVYTYTKPQRPDNLDAWYLTALDFRSGATVYRRLAGTGFGFNNNYAPVTLGPDGTAYVGVLGGVVRFAG